MIDDDLTEDERHTLVCALRLAAQKYDEAKELFNKESTFTVNVYRGLALQFEQQAKDARVLMEKLENASYILLGPVEE